MSNGSLFTTTNVLNLKPCFLCSSSAGVLCQDAPSPFNIPESGVVVWHLFPGPTLVSRHHPQQFWSSSLGSQLGSLSGLFVFPV